jgi:GH24 family phage-related lysozyme (muramidase)
MPENIDYKFIGDLEGGSRTIGYVPAAGISKSGVTIGTGFDLGQRSEADLKSLKLSMTLINKLKPYLGKQGMDAQKALKAKPLIITGIEALEIDKSVKKDHISKIKLKYDAASKKTKFIDLPPQAQTVICSVSFQYGVGLDMRAPKFWKEVISQNWPGAIKVLRNFGDAYPTRRNKEAALMEKIK